MTHENFHKKNTQLINDGFQRFRATEDCGTVECQFYGQKTTHFHCRWDSREGQGSCPRVVWSVCLLLPNCKLRSTHRDLIFLCCEHLSTALETELMLHGRCDFQNLATDHSEGKSGLSVIWGNCTSKYILGSFGKEITVLFRVWLKQAFNILLMALPC